MNNLIEILVIMILVAMSIVATIGLAILRDNMKIEGRI